MVDIKIGKNAIENLTIGMYEDSKIIYREYIQNAADSIDKAINANIYLEDEPFIDITIDDCTRTIKIKDNGLGIKKEEVHKKLADVADSDKEKGKDKGFRGIGRLGGLAYCETLRFITTAKGENVQTVMTWNAKKLIELLNDNSIKFSAEEVLSGVISYAEEECNINEHYFIVELESIRKEDSELVDVSKVREYIAANAPVPYNNKFYYRTEIQNHIKNKNMPLYEYRIFVDGEDILKNYCTVLYESLGNNKKKYDEIYGLQFKEFKNDKNELLAWMWFGVSSFDKQIPPCNEMRGIRLRKENIQIGNSETLIKLFKEQRGNYYFIGEIHAVHEDLIPNARRDYFVENQTRVEFEEEVKAFFNESLHKLYYDANKAKNAFKKESSLLDKKQEYKEKSQKGFVNSDEKKKIENEIEIAKVENEKAQKEISKLKEKSKCDPVFSKVIDIIETRHNTLIDGKVINTEVDIIKPQFDKDYKKPLFRTENLYKLNKEQRKLISRVYGVINNVLPPEMSENLIKKIENELNK